MKTVRVHLFHGVEKSRSALAAIARTAESSQSMTISSGPAVYRAGAGASMTLFRERNTRIEGRRDEALKRLRLALDARFRPRAVEFRRGRRNGISGIDEPVVLERIEQCMHGAEVLGTPRAALLLDGRTRDAIAFEQLHDRPRTAV